MSAWVGPWAAVREPVLVAPAPMEGSPTVAAPLGLVLALVAPVGLVRPVAQGLVVGLAVVLEPVLSVAEAARKPP